MRERIFSVKSFSVNIKSFASPRPAENSSLFKSNKRIQNEIKKN